MTAHWVGLVLAWGLVVVVRHRQRKAERRARRERNTRYVRFRL